jgi:hypothetical protein
MNSAASAIDTASENDNTPPEVEKEIKDLIKKKSVSDESGKIQKRNKELSLPDPANKP